MGRNLTNLPISASFQYLAQVSGSENDVTDGLGVDIDSLNVDITGTATTASYVEGSNVDGAVTNAVTASVADKIDIQGESNNAEFTVPIFDPSEGTGYNSLVANNNLQHNPGTGTLTTNVFNGDLTGNADTATTASYVAGANVDGTVATATSASFATTASFALNVTTPNLQEVTDVGASTTNDLTLTNVSASGYVSASEFIGDGSQLTGISTDPFPYTGDAEITGSLTVVDGDIVNGTGVGDASINIEAIGGANTISTDGGNAAGSVTIGQSNTSGKRDVVLGIDNSSPTAGNGTRQVVIGHTNTIASPNFTSENVIVGVDNAASGLGNNNTVIGSNINIDGGSSHVIIGNGMNYDPTGGQGTVLIGGGSNSFTANSNWGVLVGGFGNAVNNNKGGGYGGESNDSNGEYAYFIGGNNNTAAGSRSIILGGRNNETTTGAPYAAIVGGEDNTASHDRSVVVGGDTLSTSKDDEVVVPHLTISGSVNQVDSTNNSPQGFLFSSGSSITSTDKNITILGGRGNSITATGGNWGASIISSRTSTISGYDSHIFGAKSGTASGVESRIFGGASGTATNIRSHVFGGLNADSTGIDAVTLGGSGATASGQRAVVVGGDGNTASGTDSGVLAGDGNTASGQDSGVLAGLGNEANATRTVVVGGQSNTAGGSRSVVLGGEGNETTSDAPKAAIVGGNGNTASHDRSVVLGGDGLSTTKDDEVVVPHLNVQGSAIGKVNALSITSNTASMDCSLGNMFTLEINQQSDVHLAVSGSSIQAGQTINLEVTHDATNSGSLSFSGDFEFAGGTAPTITEAASSKDILTFISFNTGSLQGTSLLNFS